ncbi:MAG: MBL fold metallo-hydrolase [Peptococcaceae bacterium]|jgi:glyoxylase-like metal-dependent hydrolase (beta-lactamase superfamily II)|nr:MBL fold metallo-hydrolase [Peptococcaceae bacterium]
MFEGRTVGYLGSNCYLFACDQTKKGVLIDPGDEPDKIEQWIAGSGVTIEKILLTHGHADHIGAVGALRQAWGAKVAIHQADANMLNDRSALSYFGLNQTAGNADEYLTDGQVLQVGNEKIQVIHTPGHTPGGVCFLTSAGLFCGDTVFAGSIGRTDFAGGSHAQLMDSIRDKLLVLPDETPIFPGHMQPSTIGREKRENPFF